MQTGAPMEMQPWGNAPCHVRGPFTQPKGEAIITYAADSDIGHTTSAEIRPKSKQWELEKIKRPGRSVIGKRCTEQKLKNFCVRSEFSNFSSIDLKDK